MADNPFESFGREFRRAMEEHGKLLSEEMKRIQAQMQSPMEELKAAMGRVGAELQRAMEELHRRHPNPGDWLDAGSGDLAKVYLGAAVAASNKRYTSRS